METLLSMLLITLMIATGAGCQKSSTGHNMSAAEHANM
jgi:hypothetical protein